jgi:hypothetical protein
VESGAHTAFHLNPRFRWQGADVNYIIAFTYETGKGWHSDLGPRSRLFPFQLNKDVEVRVAMTAEAKWFKVYVNGEYSFKYENVLAMTRFVDSIKFGSVACDFKVYRARLTKDGLDDYDLKL